MPTPESADAFEKLVASRTRLTEVTKSLNAALATIYDSIEARQRYAHLQQEWERAFNDFKAATEEFSATVHRIQPPE